MICSQNSALPSYLSFSTYLHGAVTLYPRKKNRSLEEQLLKLRFEALKRRLVNFEIHLSGPGCPSCGTAEKAVLLFVLGTPSRICLRGEKHSSGVSSLEQASVKDECREMMFFRVFIQRTLDSKFKLL